jgi:tRNA modification GTPase
MLDDTIIAVSTAPGFGGIGIVRLSGVRALNVANHLFRPKKRGGTVKPRNPLLGFLFDFENKEAFEEAFLTFFPGPKSYTGEDMVEISAHGSPVVLEEIVRLGIRSGARHADSGEFTLRAYLNGRIDILQAEAVNDIIRAPSLQQARISFRQLEGSLSVKIKHLRKKFIQLLAQTEAAIEFPDDGLPISSPRIIRTLKTVQNEVSRMVESYDLGKSLSEGLSLAMTGRTNVGKSTLFNALLGKNRAIVTPFPGTTRDYLSECLQIENSVFTLIDMAGLDKTANPIEEEGIKRGRRIAECADGILLVLDLSQPESVEDLEMVRQYHSRKSILLFNKSDLPAKIDRDKVMAEADGMPFLEVSGLKGACLPELKKLILNHFVQEKSYGNEIILHLRQKLLLEEVRQAIQLGLEALNEGQPEEVFAEELRKALPPMGQLTGEIRTDDVLGEIFGRFCIGK